MFKVWPLKLGEGHYVSLMFQSFLRTIFHDLLELIVEDINRVEFKTRVENCRRYKGRLGEGGWLAANVLHTHQDVIIVCPVR